MKGSRAKPTGTAPPRRAKSTVLPGPGPTIDPLSDLTESARRGELVVVIGTGVSMGLTSGKVRALSWKGLIEHGLAHGKKTGKLAASQAASYKAHLDSNDLDELLGAAEFLSRKLDAPRGDLYARWLDEVFKPVRPTNKDPVRALRALCAAKIPICTLNYDGLLEQVTGLPAIHLGETIKAAEWMRRERPGILHLHGTFDSPETCILGIRDYETTLGNEVRDLFQRHLSGFRRLLFIGCGATFADPNFSALIRWLREKLKNAAPKHYALVSDGEVAGRYADPDWVGFVEPVGYGARHDDLPGFLIRHFQASTVAAEKKKPSAGKASASSVARARLLKDYREFLIKDCGQMTIEGLRADMDTAQRRFNIERLFVPLKVLPCPPELRESDPDREQKLHDWQEKNKTFLPFGKVLADHPRLALLALPGGGKTMLLKRLAVAYADPARRSASADLLPDLDLLPVLIRCRDWREHIHLPLATMLRCIPDITGQSELSGLSEALLPLFQKGGILLLVDGLDEVHDHGRRNTFVKHLEAFLEAHPRTRLVITSREAGFSLVAPHIARFCARWRVAPLQEDAITTLCEHWHRLMKGESAAALAESQELAQHLLDKESLRRLAENPLLLTMLLVVKHGSGGRLPADRAKLYERAVEVLLDTWNIEGHAQLQLKEAVPQLAYVAFQMMRAGKQTATESELLALLQEARDKMPQIGPYAKDAPYSFLKRVELRSSLLVETGYQMESGRALPFYQFRHLTFQEYLAAVAAFEGHYPEFKPGDTVLTPLKPYLTAEEWKEVIPMAAVLAGKQAELLMAALVAEGIRLCTKFEANEMAHELVDWQGSSLPAPVARLRQCLLEEAEATPETLTAALQVVARFGDPIEVDADWAALCQGPYGNEIVRQTWLMYSAMSWPRKASLDHTFVIFLQCRQPGSAGDTQEWQTELKELKRQLASRNPEEVARGLATCVHRLWGKSPTVVHPEGIKQLLAPVERHLFQENPALCLLAVWAWGLLQHYPMSQSSAPSILDRLLKLLLSGVHPRTQYLAGWALAKKMGLRRSAWKPVLTPNEVLDLRTRAKALGQETGFLSHELRGIYVVAFHVQKLWSDAELAKRLNSADYDDKIETTLRQMGEAGRKYLEQKQESKQRATKDKVS